MLGVLAGGFIGLGGLYFTVVTLDDGVWQRRAGGLVFSTGYAARVADAVAPPGPGRRGGGGSLAGGLFSVTFVTLGNVVGGSLMVALVYYATYLWPPERVTVPVPAPEQAAPAEQTDRAEGEVSGTPQ